MNFLLHIIVMITVFLPNILGFNVVFGRAKIFQFGPIGVSLAAAYGIFLTLTATQSYVLAILGGLALSLLVSLLFWWISQRLPPDGMGVMSIAVHLALLSLVLNWISLTRGALGIPRIPRMMFLESLLAFAFTTTLIAAVWVLLLWRLDRGSFGRTLTALAEHPWHAQSLGINRSRAHLLAFLIAGVGAVITNLFYAQYLRLLHPSDYTFVFLIFFVMVVVAGKPGSVLGCTLSAVLLTALKEALRFIKIPQLVGGAWMLQPIPGQILGPVLLILFGLILFVAVWVRRDSLFPKPRSV